jgi:hypothetical protein
MPVPCESDEVAAPARVFAPDQYATCPLVPEPIEERYVEVSIVIVPSAPLVLTKPFEVKLESFERASEPMLPLVEKRLVDDAVVEKWLVVVALVEVELRKVMFWRVEEPVTRRLAIEAIEVIDPIEPEPRLKLVEKRLVDEAVVEKWLVVVALVVVALVTMMSVSPFNVVRLLRVEVAASAVSNLN